MVSLNMRLALDSALDKNSQELFGIPFRGVLALPWQHKRVFTTHLMVALLRMQLRERVERSYEALVLAQLIDIMRRRLPSPASRSWQRTRTFRTRPGSRR
jgi:hypothetical protein